MGSVKVIMPPKEPVTDGYIYVPPGARQLRLEPIDASVTVWDEEGSLLMRDKTTTIPVKKTDVVWRISITPQRWPGAKVFADGFPVIVCPDTATARYIRGSYERLDDGTIVSHKFQVRLDRLLRRTFKSAGAFTLNSVQSYEPLTPALLSDPHRYRHLVIGYCPPLPFLNFWFERQVLDPASPYFGGVHAAASYGTIRTPYQIPGSPLNAAEPPPRLPPATDDTTHDGWTAFSPWQLAGSMGFLYGLDKKVNPYWHDERLLNRVIVAACRDLMLLNEAEIVQGRPSDWPGTFAFIFRYALADAYGYVGQAVKESHPEIHREWTEGMCRLADRLAYTSVFAPANQAAHIVYGLWQVYRGSGDPFYRELTQYTAQRLCDRLQKPAGYHVEGYGPCGSYNGITLDLFAMLYIDSQIPLFKESIRKAFYCFNHTVAAEPSGQLIGATDFNHRVRMPWTLTQHGGGKRMMAPHLEEAGVWFRKKPTEGNCAKLRDDIRERAKQIPYSMDHFAAKPDQRIKLLCGAGRRHYEYYEPDVVEGGLFPFEEQTTFIRNLGNEFICVKQPRYYLVIYVGKPGVPTRTRPVPPMKDGCRTGGGISLLWTPEYRVALAGQGWDAYAHHGLVVDKGNDLVRTADYFAVEFDLDEANACLAVRGEVREMPLRYAYKYRFLPDRVQVETQIEAAKQLEAKACYLQFPLFASKERGFHPTVASEPTVAVRVADDTGAGIEVRFDAPVTAALGHTSEKQIWPVDYVVRQLKAKLPARWASGECVTLRYEIVPFSREARDARTPTLHQ